MKNINNEVFLSKITDRIKNGDFDTQLNLPFMTRTLLFANIKAKLTKRIESGGTPVLSDIEVDECIKDVKEVAVSTIALYLKLGFIIQNDDKQYEFTDKMQLALKALRTRR